MNVRDAMAGWPKLYDMFLGEVLNLDGMEIIRVPGGWIFVYTVQLKSKYQADPSRLSTYSHALPPVFVPYSPEFITKAPTVRVEEPKPPTPPAPPPTPARAPTGTNRDDDDTAPF